MWAEIRLWADLLLIDSTTQSPAVPHTAQLCHTHWHLSRVALHVLILEDVLPALPEGLVTTAEMKIL